jgi:UDP-N-acetylglucosamine 2-epimerase (non-hydrolysing)
MTDVIRRRQPDVVIVQGDTTTNFGASLAAFYERVPVAHVEAGLRSADLHNPFPEEAHRILTDSLAAVHYAPTDRARKNLLAEGRDPTTIQVVGNTVVDALYAAIASADGATDSAMPRPPNPGDGPHKTMRSVLVTAHRRESFDTGIDALCGALLMLTRDRDDVEVTYVLHPNPQARRPALARLTGASRIRLVEPLPYTKFVRAMSAADLVVSDSGGIQEEAPYLGVRVLVTRTTTERQEVTESGWVRLVGLDTGAIIDGIKDALDGTAWTTPSQPTRPLGDGHAAEMIRDDLIHRFATAALERPSEVEHQSSDTVRHGMEPVRSRIDEPSASLVGEAAASIS